MGIKELSEFDIHTREPESMYVGELNKVVRALREIIYQKELRIQDLEKQLLPLLIALKENEEYTI